MKEILYDNESIIIKSGSISDKIYIIWRGEINVELNYKDKKTYFDTLN